MSQRISILVALDGADEGLKRAITSAERSLGELAASAKTAGDKAAAGLAQVKAGVSVISEQITTARTQLLAFLSINWAVGKAQEIVQIADAWNMMAARLKLATAGQREFTTAQTALFDIAQRIGVPIQETATLYGKLQQAVRMLGAEQQQALTITESISQALRISGASANETQSALLQFGQALAAGVLRGEEFNSVVENSPRLAQALADGLNVPIGRLRKMAEEGRLTADVVVGALLSQKNKLATEYAQLPATVSQAFERLRNAVGQYISRVDQATGFTAKLSDALTWLAQNLDTVMQWLKRIAEVGLAVLVYRLLPALVTAWQTAGAAAVTAASATSAAWATANLSVSAAIASVGLLRTGFATLGAFLVGWEIGTWLSERFEIVRRAGIVMVEVLIKSIEELRFHWEVFAAAFTSDTLAEATRRHQARLGEMNQVFAQMVADAGRGADAAKGAMNTAASVAEEIAKRLEAVRQGTQEAVGRGAEAVHTALEKLKSRIGEVESAVAKASQTVNDATARIAEAYKGFGSIVEANLQRQVEAVKTRYQQEQAALERSGQAQAVQIARSTQLLVEALTQQTALRRQAATDALKLIDDESGARVAAAARDGKTEAERAANVQRVENEILATRRQTLTQAAADYRQHIDALNAEANRHLGEIRRIEDEKRQLSMSTEERIRDIRRQGMTDFEAQEDRKRQIADYQASARAALADGEFDLARQRASQAMDLAAQVASTQSSEAKRAEDARRQSEQAVTQAAQLEAEAREARGRQESAQAEALMRQADELRAQSAQRAANADAQAVQGKTAVNEAIGRIRDSEAILNQTLDAEAQAHQRAAQSAVSARQSIQQTLAQTDSQIAQLTAKLQQGLKVTIDADTGRFDKAIAELDKALAERERLVIIQADLEQAEKTLQDYEQRLKEGKTLPVDADVSKALASLDKLNAYARDNAQLELRVATDKARAAIANVEGMLRALDRVQTESRHAVASNVDAVRAEVQSLNGMNTSSTHTIAVRRVEANAAGGVVGGGVQPFAEGGPVAPAFPRMQGGSVPGAGDQDTVPRTLDAGAYVIRKAAVRKYGAGTLAQLANGVARFATGGAVLFGGRGGSQPGGAKRNRDVVEARQMIELGLQGMGDYTSWAQHNGGAWVSSDMRSRTMTTYGRQAERDRQTLDALATRKQLTAAERQTLERIKTTWRQAMAQPMLWGQDLERDLLDYMEQHQGEFYRDGGVAASDTVPAMLTPGEYVVNRQAVARHGVGFFDALNNLALPARALANTVRGFAIGGLVQPLAGMAARASQAVAGGWKGADPVAALSQVLATAMRAPAPAYAAEVAPARTIRVELASGSRTVAATIDARDEARLLELLKDAQSRAL
ncbi:phage tail tape measure protein [Ralstonia pseudosolanacearum]|uniref:tape measure protein n=1 Tax=Ralstonia pseudosolanacearum TaxID=1310165 RepID=UPI001867FB53|nr:tape measure protein [Ralstonia pseudosolanacearum]QOK92448.1 phage tail tape measure protein [Ralstonia pseudosolanacearum]